jgi:hypothetical protein
LLIGTFFTILVFGLVGFVSEMLSDQL